MKRKLLCILFALCLVCSCLGACARQPEKSKFTAYSMDYFDTVITITGYEYTQQEFDAVSEEILEQFSLYHRLFNIYLRFDGLSNLCTVNELVKGAHQTVDVDPRIVDMLVYAREMYDLTDGMMNVAMGSVLYLWHNYRMIGMDDPSQASLPPMEALRDASAHTDIDAMVIDEERSTVTLTDPGMRLDVGAIAKGYATECVAKGLEEKGITGYVLNVGGNIRTIGAKPDGSSWTVGIENPNGEDYLAYLALNGQSLVTSGSYQRFYYVDGKPYHHIIHPDTLMPAQGYTSVSVICPDSGMGDALSTALFCMSFEDGLALVESLDSVEAMWVSEDLGQKVSSGWADYLKE